jgi:hypothetical protein
LTLSRSPYNDINAAGSDSRRRVDVGIVLPIDMDKRSITVSLLLVGLGFLGIVHTLADIAYGTGLSGIGIVLVGIALIGIVLVNR